MYGCDEHRLRRKKLELRVRGNRSDVGTKSTTRPHCCQLDASVMLTRAHHNVALFQRTAKRRPLFPPHGGHGRGGNHRFRQPSHSHGSPYNNHTQYRNKGGQMGSHNNKHADPTAPLYYSGDTAHYHPVPSFYGGRPQFMGGGMVRLFIYVYVYYPVVVTRDCSKSIASLSSFVLSTVPLFPPPMSFLCYCTRTTFLGAHYRVLKASSLV